MFFENDRELGRITYPDGTVVHVFSVPVSAFTAYDPQDPSAAIRPFEIMAGLPGNVYALLEERYLAELAEEKLPDFDGDEIRFQQYLFNAVSYMALTFLQESGKAPFG